MPPSRPPGPAPAGAARPGPGRFLAAAALVVVVLVVLYLLLAGGGGENYHLIFKEGDQLVRGDQVQVGGVPVGSVTEIELTDDFRARITIHVDSSLTPLHEGTKAEVRVPSLSSVANRYIQLAPGPNNKPSLSAGATLPASATKEVTDLDQLFNALNKKTLKGLQGFIQGTAEQYAGAGRSLGESTEYFGPALSSTDHFFAELVKDQPVFEHFLVETAKAVTTIGARAPQLSDLIENQNKTFGAIGEEQEQLAQGLTKLPVTLRQGNKTFAQLPSAFAALKKLVETSRGEPTQKLITLLDRLRPLVTTATPAVRNFHEAFSRPGADNDLTDLVRSLPSLATALESSSPSSVTALQESIPITAFFGPYSPDLSGTLKTFGQAASYYDADGHYVRVSPIFPNFKLEGNVLKPTPTSTVLGALKKGQLRRCPGAATQPAADGSSPVNEEVLTCDPSETP